VLLLLLLLLLLLGFIKGEALRILRTNSSQRTFEENIRNFAARRKNRGYPAAMVEKHLSEVKFSKKNKHRFKIKTEPHKRKFYPSRNTTPRCLT